ncbi:MAG: DUF502 domain-containing protein [Gammaproteobacteria bacterium]|nr:DUF502 domain-containing protein [Gammaproteobacteria bacterium]NNF48380.1 DUF502 domain-containing protein [Woeseiaceae bacterium]MBT8093587.1 DUF502 domain-containing protein [Gammaproteobacteria bacterium]MBT8104284.1 DUF502 domain-containing protein [Gammaproteobacteria bacterium]NNK24299.1 DUF502 domain-containing protein [Woeseiaceae bacterium]
MKRIRRYLVAGILVWVPLGVTFLLLRFAVNVMDKTLAVLPRQYQPDELLGFHIPGLGVILTIIVLFLTGALAANFVGRHVVGGWESLMRRIPIVRSIYGGAKNFAEIVFSDGNDSFKNVLLIEYPRKGIYCLAFQTSSELGEVQEKTGEDVVCCFVPTTPNPTSGFVIMVPRKEVRVLDMTVDEALKMVISLGVVVPQWRREQTAELPFKDGA